MTSRTKTSYELKKESTREYKEEKLSLEKTMLVCSDVIVVQLSIKLIARGTMMHTQQIWTR